MLGGLVSIFNVEPKGGLILPNLVLSSLESLQSTCFSH